MAGEEMGKKSSAFNERMCSVLSAIDAAMGQERRGEELEQKEDSSPLRDPPQRADRSRSPVEHRERRRDREYRDERVYRDERSSARDRDDRIRRDYGSRRPQRGNFDRRRGSGYKRKPLPAPDYVVNPSKWKKYDLSNDGTEGLKKSGMTDDQVNTFAAFQFLKDIRERRQREEGGSEEEVSDRVVFKTPSKRVRERGRDGEGGDGEKKEVLSGAGVGAGVIKMAEYVVGEQVQGKGRGSRKGRSQAVEKGESVKKTSCVNLSHLAEEELEED